MKLRSFALAIALVTSTSVFAFADAVTTNNNPGQLANAVISGNTGVTIVGASLQGQSTGGAVSSGTFTNIYGLQSGAVLSTGNAGDYGSGPNTSTNKTTAYNVPATAAQNALLSSLTAGNVNHFDVTQLDLDFTVAPQVDQVFFNVAFGSEEYPAFVGSSFVDAFALYLNGVNIAFVNGLPVNINHPCFAAVGGTELNGLLACGGNPVNTFSGGVNSGVNHLTFIIADTSDANLDTTAYIGALGTTNVAQTPEPSSLMLLGTGVLAMMGAVRRRLQA